MLWFDKFKTIYFEKYWTHRVINIILLLILLVIIITFTFFETIFLENVTYIGTYINAILSFGIFTFLQPYKLLSSDTPF